LTEQQQAITQQPIIYMFEATDSELLIESYDVRGKLWLTLPPLVNSCPWLAAARVGSSVYVIGGTGCNDVHRYTPATRTWRSMAPLSAPREGHIAIQLNGLIYVIGGAEGAKRVAKCEVYDPATNSWSVIPSMYHGRSHWLSGVAFNGKLYVFGGEFGDTESAECYDPIKKKWNLIASPPSKCILGHAVVLDDTILLLGGDAPIEQYEPLTKTWTTMKWKLPGQQPQPQSASSSSSTSSTSSSCSLFGAQVIDNVLYVLIYVKNESDSRAGCWYLRSTNNDIAIWEKITSVPTMSTNVTSYLCSV